MPVALYTTSSLASFTIFSGYFEVILGEVGGNFCRAVTDLIIVTIKIKLDFIVGSHKRQAHYFIQAGSDGRNVGTCCKVFRFYRYAGAIYGEFATDQNSKAVFTGSGLVVGIFEVGKVSKALAKGRVFGLGLSQFEIHRIAAAIQHDVIKPVV